MGTFWDDIEETMNVDRIDGVFKFGRHKCKKWTDVPPGYLTWYYENVDKSICSQASYRSACEEDFEWRLEFEAITDGRY